MIEAGKEDVTSDSAAGGEAGAAGGEACMKGKKNLCKDIAPKFREMVCLHSI